MKRKWNLPIFTAFIPIFTGFDRKFQLSIRNSLLVYHSNQLGSLRDRSL